MYKKIYHDHGKNTIPHDQTQIYEHKGSEADMIANYL